MNYEDFKDVVADAVREELYERGFEGVDISFRETVKANETYESMTISPADSRIGINLNIEEFYEELENGVDLSEVIDRITDITVSAAGQMPNVDLEELRDYDRMKDKLSVEVISQEANQELLANVPHKNIEDMAIIYRFVLDDGNMGMQSITVTNDIMASLGVTLDQLHEDAMANSPQMRPPVIMGMTEILREMMGPEMFDMVKASMESEKEMLYVATTPDKINGAGVMAYPSFMEQAAEKLEGSFFILPSSRHEIILVADDGNVDFRDLKGMVEQVNATEVSPRDKLTDNVYHYDSEAKVFELASSYEARMMEKEEAELSDAKASVLKDLCDKKDAVAARPKDVIDKGNKSRGGDAL